MEKLPGDYIAGFVDGEGCFALKFRRDVRHDRKGSPAYFYWAIEFAIMLKSDDTEILRSIKNTLDCGWISNVDKRGLVRYSVSRVDDLLKKVVPFFELYELHAKKRHDFKLWRKALTVFKRNQRSKNGPRRERKTMWTEKDTKELKSIHEEMMHYKGGNRGNWKWLK